MMRKIKIDWIGIFIVMFLSCMVIVCNSDRLQLADIKFFYNRAVQMLDCLKDGNIPFFYYSDFGGVGYGSAFFYGQLTIYPFLVFVNKGIDVFINAYTIAMITLTYTGACFLSKRFTKNYKFIALLYMCSCYITQSMYSFAMLPNIMAIALSFYFIGFCIDFFRDKKSFVQASILFYLVINTHLVTAVISFIICVILFIIYFDKSRFKDYIKFELFTTFICSYFLVNAFYHSDIITNTSEINEQMLDHKLGTVCCTYENWLPFTGILFNCIINMFGFTNLGGYRLLNLAVVLLLITWGRHRFTRREVFVLITDIVATIVSIDRIWGLINKIWLIPIQFPCRFASYIVLSIIIIFLRNKDLSIWKRRIFIICCLPELILMPFVVLPDTNVAATDYSYQVINGEYLDKSFSWDLNNFEYKKNHVTDQDGDEYDFSVFPNKVIVSVHGSKDKDIQLTLPKLYYRGYTFSRVEVPEAFTAMNEKEFYNHTYTPFITNTYNVEIGDSQFIKVDIGASSGTFVLTYEHPVWLILLDAITLIIVVVSVLNLIFYKLSSDLA